VSKVQHRITREAQPIADQWMLRCSCGWSRRVDLWDPALNSQAAIQQRIDFEVQKHLGVLILFAMNMRVRAERNDFGFLTFGWLPLLRPT
jgi:hypothetical protein